MSYRIDCDLCDAHMQSGEQVVTATAASETTDFCLPCWPDARALFTPERLTELGRPDSGVGVFISLRVVR